MLEPREADIPVLFLVLVVLPLVAYFLLGKWSEAAKKRERIDLLAHMATEESLKAEAVPTVAATANAFPFVSPSKNGIHVCARCLSPATTRCSRCKSVRYCSGRCQIIHWRQVHKQECQQSETTSSCSSPNASAIKDAIPERASSFSICDSLNSFYSGYHIKSALMNNAPSENTVHPPIIDGVSAWTNSSVVDGSHEAMLKKRSTEKWVYCKSNREMFIRHDMAVLDSSEETSGTRPACINSSGDTTGLYVNGQDTAHYVHVIPKYLREPGKMVESKSKNGPLGSLHSGKNGIKVHETETGIILNGENLSNVENTSNDEMGELKCSYETTPMKGSVKGKCALQPVGNKISKSSKSTMKVFGEQSCSEVDGRGKIADDSKTVRMGYAIPAPGSNGVAGVGIVKMMGIRRSTRLSSQNVTGINDVHKKMLFPYEEFVKMFNCESVNLSPRGLVNCGNSCYANAVLQCLTCTKPLVIFLLRRSHSRACCGKDWCLMCELEKHVMLLRECGGPLSPSRILLHMQNINCQIGGGSQEDAHEFLRLLVASMQAICLEGQGGEDKVNPMLQETTFIQHTFGGRLRSKVKCLRCHHESERHESIMDLTLEIFGWVESLEDALTQFTTPEELDGENMYRCGRCATYVRARKQLSIHEAPNILTIVLKRFQGGQYGKINKCITFPDMLDMIPFMSGTEDIPPLYMLYAVVVHLDTLNASFSGHYVAYVKDLHGNWFRVDDTEVHPVPMSQVMSEGAYILFYMRSCPRLQREFYEKPIQQQVSSSARHCSSSRMQKPSRKGHGKSSSHFLGTEPSLDLKPKKGTGLDNHTNGILGSTNRNVAQAMEFSDATSSDWSLFTSSDEASFSTESRDSFSTVDYAETCNADTLSSIFNNLYPPQLSSQNTFCCRTFSSSRPQTKFISDLEESGYVLDSFLSTQSTKGLWRGNSSKRVSNSTEFPTLLL